MLESATQIRLARIFGRLVSNALARIRPCTDPGRIKGTGYLHQSSTEQQRIQGVVIG